MWEFSKSQRNSKNNMNMGFFFSKFLGNRETYDILWPEPLSKRAHVTGGVESRRELAAVQCVESAAMVRASVPR